MKGWYNRGKLEINRRKDHHNPASKLLGWHNRAKLEITSSKDPVGTTERRSKSPAVKTTITREESYFVEF